MDFFRRADKRHIPFDYSRILVPLVISDEDLSQGLENLERALGDAGA